jgi:hypothetical protein
MTTRLSFNIFDAHELICRAEKQSNVEWLALQFGKTATETITIFMPFERAEFIANAINKAEADYENWLAEQTADREPSDAQSYAAEHRLRQHEVM